MRFVHAEIYGFGKWIDTTFDFSTSTFISLYGENESSKSTLQQFILYILFDLPPRKRQVYMPKNSSRFGGLLTVEHESIGTFTIERTADTLKCLLPNGETESDDWLHEQLQGLTREMYEAIYSFSALELSEIQRMKAPQLSEVLFSVGLTGSTNIYKVEKQFDTKLGELFKKTGWKPLINEQIKKVNELNDTLLKEQQKEQAYNEKKEQRTYLIEQIAEAKQQVQQLHERLLKNEKRLTVVPLLNQYRRLNERKSQLPTEIPFPEDGVRRLQIVKDQLLPLKSEVTILKQNINEYEEKMTELKEKQYEKEVYEHANTIVKNRQSYENNLRDMNRLEDELVDLNKLLKQSLQETNLVETDVEETFLPFHLETSWQEIKQTDQQLRRESDQLTEQLQVVLDEINRLKQQQIEKEKNIIDYHQLMKIKKENNQYDEFHMAMKNYEEEQKKWHVWSNKKKKTARITFIAFAIFAIITCLLGFSLNDSLYYVIGLFSLLLGLGQSFYVFTSIKDIQQHTAKKPVGSIITKTTREQNERIIIEQEQLSADIKLINNELKRLNYSQLQLEEKIRLFNERKNKWLDQIETERYQYPFLIGIEPMYWVELLQHVQRIKQVLINRQERREQLANAKQKVDEFHAQLNLFSDKVKSETVMTIEQIEHLLETARAHEQLMNQYCTFIDENKNKMNELDEQIQLYEIEITKLYTFAKVNSEEAFLKAAKNKTEKQQLSAEMEKIEEQIESMFSKDNSKKLFENEWNENELEIKINQNRKEISNNEKVISNGNRQLATIEMEMKQMEMSDDTSKIAFLYEMERNKLNEIGRAHVLTPVTWPSRMPSSA